MNDERVISLADPVLGEAEKQALCAVIDSGWLTMGAGVSAFERTFAELHRLPEAVAVSSCTAGLHLSLLALGVGPGDEVLVPAVTFVATANAVLYAGATPVFVDLEHEHRPHLSLADAAAKCGPRTKAVIVMHYGGYLVDLPAWRAFADERRLCLIEDAAHAPGLAQVGEASDAAVFSFFTNKNLTTAEGGMVTAAKPQVADRVRSLRSHAMTKTTLDRHRGHAYSYDVTGLGFNYRMDELRAALGAAQLPRLQDWNARRRVLSQVYRDRLALRGDDVAVPFAADHPTAAHLMPVLLPAGADRETVMDRLRADGIQSSIHYPPLHRFSYYRHRYPGVSLPRSEAFCAAELSLPLHPGLNEADVTRVVDSLSAALGR